MRQVCPRKPPRKTAASSGRALINIILETIQPTCGAELNSLEEELTKPFFKMGMGETAAKLAARRLKALRAQLPASSRGGQRELLRQQKWKVLQDLHDSKLGPG